MIAVRLGTPAWSALDALARYDGATAEELARDLVSLPPLTLTETTGPNRLALLHAREERRRAEVQRIGRLLGRLQEQGLIETRGRARVSEDWRAVVARRGEVSALRCLSGWMVREAEAGPFLRLIGRVEIQPGCVAQLAGQDGQRYRHLVSWGVLVAPSQRYISAQGRALLDAAEQAAA